MDSSVWSNLLAGIVKGYSQAKEKKKEFETKNKPSIDDVIKKALWEKYQSGKVSPEVLKGLDMYVKPDETGNTDMLRAISNAIGATKTISKNIEEPTGWESFLSKLEHLIPGAQASERKVLRSKKAHESLGDVSNLLLEKLKGVLGGNTPQQSIQPQTDPIVQRISELKQQGWSDEGISQALREKGIDPSKYGL